jgi:hypothetical protein
MFNDDQNHFSKYETIKVLDMSILEDLKKIC